MGLDIGIRTGNAIGMGMNLLLFWQMGLDIGTRMGNVIGMEMNPQ
jgi:hypothetical protein